MKINNNNNIDNNNNINNKINKETTITITLGWMNEDVLDDDDDDNNNKKKNISTHSNTNTIAIHLQHIKNERQKWKKY